MRHRFPLMLPIACAAITLAAPGTSKAGFIQFSVGGDTTTASIQATVDAFRAAVGNPNNGNAAGPLASGRREINWDGGGSTATSVGTTPFDVFLNTRGSQFKTPGLGLSQAPPSGGHQGGLAVLFGNPTLRHHLQGLQPVAVVHACGEQHHRSVLLHTGYQWHCPGNS